MKRMSAIAVAVAALFATSSAPVPASYSVLIHGGTIYDGSGSTPYVGDVALKGDRTGGLARQAASSPPRLRRSARRSRRQRFRSVLLRHPIERPRVSFRMRWSRTRLWPICLATSSSMQEH